MNEEISRILQLLEAGKVSADEAERLIRAVRETPPTPPPHNTPPQEAPFEPFRGIRDVFRWISEAQERALRRQSRWRWWMRYRMARRERRRRGERAANRTVAERVRFVLLERVNVLDRDPKPETRLSELMAAEPCSWEHSIRFAWETLRYALEFEFCISAELSELKALETVQSLVEYVEARIPAEAAGDSSEARAETTTEASKPAATRRRQDSQPAEPAPGTA